MTLNSRLFSSSGLARSFLALAGVLAMTQGAQAQTWTKITRNPPGAISLMLLLTDGTVMCMANNGTSSIGNGVYRLTPDNHGSYINGTWTTLASMIDTRLYYPSQVLKDGRVFVAGGEYGTGGPKAEIYNPVTNTWTNITPPAALWSTSADTFYDCNSDLTDDGSVLTMPVGPHSSGVGLRYNPATNIWSNAGRLFRGFYQDEASWVKLPDHSILTIDPFGVNSERYISTTNTWINDSNVPVSLYDSFGSELGGAVLLPNGKAFFIGSTGHNALYTPSGSNAPGVWVAAADTPSAKGAPDAPASMMANGKVLCVFSPVPTSANHFPSPSTFYEYDYLTNAFTSVGAPAGASQINAATYTMAMLNLPDGGVMFSRFGTSVYVYTSPGAPQQAWKPVITSVSLNGDGTYHLTGTQLNGISQGATYGDDLQMNTNYPIVRINSSGGNVYYAKTFNWTNTGVMTGATSVSTEFSLPVGLPAGLYTIQVSASGINSDTFCLNAPFISPSPSPASTCVGGNASFTVNPGGVGPFTYQWRKGLVNLTNAGHFSGVTTTVLTITGASLGDAASNYNCVVSNGCGSATSAEAALSVCAGDFNCDGAVDFFDYDDFVVAFEAGSLIADFDGDGTVDFFDYDAFVTAFESPC